tara:strand:+ start:719 stop:1129 length:411 start_codon:yes stop_codon:yes gene_type:complete
MLGIRKLWKIFRDLWFGKYASLLQTSNIFIDPTNKVKKHYKFDDIYKLTIDKKENDLTFESLDELNADKDVSKFAISLFSYSTEQVLARYKPAKILTDTKINFYPCTSVDPKLMQTISNERYMFVEYFQCTRAEKY